jgi:hypothetical protein
MGPGVGVMGPGVGALPRSDRLGLQTNPFRAVEVIARLPYLPYLVRAGRPVTSDLGSWDVNPGTRVP